MHIENKKKKGYNIMYSKRNNTYTMQEHGCLIINHLIRL